MAKLERSYNIPLRREWLKSPKYKRSKKAVKAIREFLAKHMKADISEVKIGKHLNEDVWKHGIKNPPHHIKVNVVKEDSGKVFAELVGHKIEEMVAEKGKKKKEKLEKPKAPKEEKKKEEKAAEKKEEPKKEEKSADKPEGMPEAINVKKIEPKPAEEAKEEKKPEPKKEEMPKEAEGMPKAVNVKKIEPKKEEAQKEEKKPEPKPVEIKK